MLAMAIGKIGNTLTVTGNKSVTNRYLYMHTRAYSATTVRGTLSSVYSYSHVYAYSTHLTNWYITHNKRVSIRHSPRYTVLDTVSRLLILKVSLYASTQATFGKYPMLRLRFCHALPLQPFPVAHRLTIYNIITMGYLMVSGYVGRGAAAPWQYNPI